MIDIGHMQEVGQLIGFAVQPNVRTATDLEYRRLVDQYRSKVEFASATDAVLTGLGLEVLSVDELGIVVAPTRDSPFVFRLADVGEALRADADQRLICGLALLGIAAYGYPTPADLEEAHVRYADVQGIDDLLRAAFDELAARADSDPDTDEYGMDEAWRPYRKMRSLVTSKRGGRPTKECTQYWIAKVLEWLHGQGMARPAAGRGEGRYVLNERFRIHVRELAAHAAYTYLTEHVDHIQTNPDGVVEEGER